MKNKKTENGIIPLPHDGICHHKVIADLMNYEEDVLSHMNPKIRDNGFITVSDNSDTHEIKAINDCWAGAFIPSIALGTAGMDDGDYAACTIVNTINNGFVYASVDDQNNVKAIGPVVTPCVVGNTARPQGLYIPFNNRDSIQTGIDFALDYLIAINNSSIPKTTEDTKNNEVPKKLLW